MKNLDFDFDDQKLDSSPKITKVHDRERVFDQDFK